MLHRRLLPAAALVLGLTACTTPVYTLPNVVAPESAPRHYDLSIPLDLEVRSVDFAVAAYSELSQISGVNATSLGGRSFIKVYAVHRKTGEQFLLLYEDAAHRRTPIQVIRFVPTLERSASDSTG